MLSHRRHSRPLALIILPSLLQWWYLTHMCRTCAVRNLNQDWVLTFTKCVKCLFCIYLDDHILVFILVLLVYSITFVDLCLLKHSHIQEGTLFGCDVWIFKCAVEINLLDFYICDYHGNGSAVFFFSISLSLAFGNTNLKERVLEWDLIFYSIRSSII